MNHADQKKDAKNPRLLAIGLDGATWTILEPLMAEGLLPNLKKLVAQGASGALRSTIPAHSGPAWTSFMTGVNPGKHGIFGFLHRTYDRSFSIRPVSSRDIQSPTLFEILSDSGLRAGSVNLPITYPPIPVNGFMISDDMMRPESDGEFTYPKDLFNQIGWDVSQYNEGEVRLQVHDGRDELLIEHCRKRVGVRLEVTLRLMERYAWDFLTVVFTETDRIQHLLWHVLDPTHHRHDPVKASRLRPLLREFYQEVDMAIGTLLEKTDSQTWICILSDHGFGPQASHFLINRFFEKEGLLKIKTKRLREYQRKIRGFLHQHSALYRGIKKFLKSPQKSRKTRKSQNASSQHVKMTTFLGAVTSKKLPVEWSKTSLYSLAESGAGAHVNLKGREPNGIVAQGRDYEAIRDRAIKALNQLKDPKTGEPLDMKWHCKEELYFGSCVENAPDILCVNESSSKLNGQLREDWSDCFMPTTHTTGDHREAGIVVLFGPGVEKGAHLNGGKILDIAPTFLYLLGLPVPRHMDGKVLTEALEKTHLLKRPVVMGDEVIKETRAEEVYSEKEMAKIEQRLGDLGYLE